MSDLNPIDQDTLLREIRAYLPTPVREGTKLHGSFNFVGGDPGEVVVRVRGSKVLVAIFAVTWNGPHTPVLRPKAIGTLNWRRLPASGTKVGLRSLIESARELRLAKYRKCERCDKTKPPEPKDRRRKTTMKRAPRFLRGREAYYHAPLPGN